MTICLTCAATLLDSDPREQTDDSSTWFDHLDWPADGHLPHPYDGPVEETIEGDEPELADAQPGEQVPA